MQFDSRSLGEFYESPLGSVTRRMVQTRLKRIWPDLRDCRVLGYGYAVPYLRALQLQAERVIAVMPEPQGPQCWPQDRCLSVLADEETLPFPDALFDRVLIVHGIETADSARVLMRQIWRVMAPAGRLLVIAPNRASLWAQVDRSPFAYGRPFTRAQLERLLKEAMFVPEQWDSALFLPPLKSRQLVGRGVTWEQAGRRLWPGLAGLHLVEATKSLYAAVPIPQGKRARAALVPARG
jgi:SAM-dependent methyltransferase